MAVVETIIATLIRCIVVPVNWWAQHQIRRANTAGVQAIGDCRCGVCGVTDFD